MPLIIESNWSAGISVRLDSAKILSARSKAFAFRMNSEVDLLYDLGCGANLLVGLSSRADLYTVRLGRSHRFFSRVDSHVNVCHPLYGVVGGMAANDFRSRHHAKS